MQICLVGLKRQQATILHLNTRCCESQQTEETRGHTAGAAKYSLRQQWETSHQLEPRHRLIQPSLPRSCKTLRLIAKMLLTLRESEGLYPLSNLSSMPWICCRLLSCTNPKHLKYSNYVNLSLLMWRNRPDSLKVKLPVPCRRSTFLLLKKKYKKILSCIQQQQLVVKGEGGNVD